MTVSEGNFSPLRIGRNKWEGICVIHFYILGHIPITGLKHVLGLHDK